ncbi:hypothetical protein BDE02_12G097300 [Populus trichocarpa]|nr:hypothetical protein BDE02_12G097300 [Populus trichocarpa]
MLSMATHKSFSSACRAFVTISRPIWPRFWSRSMRFACPSRLDYDGMLQLCNARRKLLKFGFLDIQCF